MQRDTPKQCAPEHKGELEDITADAWNVSGPPSEPLSLITPCCNRRSGGGTEVFSSMGQSIRKGGGDGFSTSRLLEVKHFK